MQPNLPSLSRKHSAKDIRWAYVRAMIDDSSDPCWYHHPTEFVLIAQLCHTGIY
jgi:hypothetical protein